MKVFRNYLDDKLRDPAFKKYYFENCAICPITVEIVTAVSKSREPIVNIASKCDVTVQAIEDLKAAEKCCVASVRKLCDFFGIPGPEDCRQLKCSDK